MTNCGLMPIACAIRVVIIDDQLLFRVGIKSLMDRAKILTCVGEASSRAEGLAAVASTQPDVILLDLNLRGECALDFLPDLLATNGDAKVLILTGTRDEELMKKAVRMGARGLVMKDQSFEVLAKAIERVYAGEMWLDRSMTVAVIEELSRRQEVKKTNPDAVRIETLTDREREVITAVGEGLRNKEIGERLFISDITVRHHLTSIYSKLEVSDRLELIIYAYRHGLVPIPR
jgi:two-component system, NarL family, nitrate/nitrite response regulator NarL